MLIDQDTSRLVRAEGADRLRAAQARRRRFVAHAAALLVALLGLIALIDNGQSAITDESAVVAQVEAVSGGRWEIDLPMPSVDPDGRFVTMENSDLADGAYLPYAKHPAYPLLLVPFWQLFGHFGLLVASVLGVWAASIAGLLISLRLTSGRGERTRPSVVSGAVGTSRSTSTLQMSSANLSTLRRRDDLAITTMWLLGLASPLIFDATVVMAHGIAAALLGFAVLAVVRFLDTGRVAAAAVAVALVVPLVLIRSEGFLAAGGLTVAVAFVSVSSWRPLRVRLPSLLLAGVIGLVGAASYVVDGRWAASVVGTRSGTPFSISNTEGFLEGRTLALWASIVRPGDPTLGPPSTVILLAVGCLIGAALVLRLRPDRSSLVVQLVVAGAALTLLRQYWPPGQITGLLAAFPLLAMGLVLVRRSDLRSATAKLCIVATTVTSLAVLATSYSIGGASEWGGRFYHVVLPLIVPVAVLGLAHGRAALPARDQRLVAVGLIVACVSLSVLWIRADIAMRGRTDNLVEMALESSAAAGSPADGGTPIIVTDGRGLGRLMWNHLDDVRILRMPEEGQLGGLLDELAAQDVGSVTLAIGHDEPLGPSVLGEWTVEAERARPGSAWLFVELRQ